MTRFCIALTVSQFHSFTVSQGEGGWGVVRYGPGHIPDILNREQI